MTLTTLIFDVDGTLADTERDAHRVAFNQAFTEQGLPFIWDVETYGVYLKVTGGKERMRRFLDDHPQYPQLSDDEIRALHRRKTDLYVEMMDAGIVPLRPGVARLLQAAQEAGLRLGIATTTTPDNVRALLRSTLGADAWDRFDYVGAGDIVAHKKPAPDIYQHVLQTLAVPAHQALALEDSSNGLRSALAADLPVLITCTDYTLQQDFQGALRVLDHLGEVDRPAQILSGPGAGQEVVVDIPQLREWHAETR